MYSLIFSQNVHLYPLTIEIRKTKLRKKKKKKKINLKS